MLPGFRFVCVAIVLSLSLLMFGLGAAALLRAAHEQFASMPTRLAPPGPVFASMANELTTTLAMIRVDPPAAEVTEPAPTPDIEPAGTVDDKPVDAKTVDAKAFDPDPKAVDPEVVDTEPEAKPGNAKPEDAKPGDARARDTEAGEAAMPDVPATNTTAQAEQEAGEAAARAEQTASLTAADRAAAAPPVEASAPTPEAVATAPEPSPPAEPVPSPALTKIATLGGPAVTISEPAKPAAAKPTAEAGKTSERTKGSKPHRRVAKRAQGTAAVLPASPFTQPTPGRAAIGQSALGQPTPER